MITVKHIDTIDGIKDLIFEQTYNADIDRTRSSYCYRGMRSVAYDLTTSLFRNCKAVKQMDHVFGGTAITEVPAGLFDAVSNATIFTGAFSACG